jgi:hypothetical protein
MNHEKPQTTEKREVLDVEVPKGITKKFGSTTVVLVNEPERLPYGTFPGFSKLFLQLYGNRISAKLLGPN